MIRQLELMGYGRGMVYVINSDTWHEINRPQIHGYDFNSLCCLNQNEGEKVIISKLITAADEKILRTFLPPYNIIKFVQKLSEENILYSKEHDNEYYDKCNNY
jgi:elongator complex protein 2